MVAVVERTAARWVIELLVDAVSGQEEADFADRGWQLKLLEDREKHVLDTLGRRLRPAAEEGADAFEVFNDAQDHVLRAAWVHTERVILEAFVAGIQRCEDPDQAELLDQVCDLYVLSAVE